MGQGVMALMRLEYAFDRITFQLIGRDEVDAILGGQRDAEVKAWAAR
jgi:hypothetical protein